MYLVKSWVDKLLCNSNFMPTNGDSSHWNCFFFFCFYGNINVTCHTKWAMILGVCLTAHLTKFPANIQYYGHIINFTLASLFVYFLCFFNNFSASRNFPKKFIGFEVCEHKCVRKSSIVICYTYVSWRPKHF